MARDAGRGVTPLRQALADYLSVRRALGFRLDRAEKLLSQFISYLEDRDAATVTTEHALAWATSPGGDPWWHVLRLSAVRPFATWLRTLDPAAEIPPPGLIRAGTHRATPYLYSGTEITALMTAATRLPRPVSALTYPALIGLLAVTGMRIGEAIALQVSDFDSGTGILTIRHGKFGKTRLLPLHPTTTAALTRYLRDRSQLSLRTSRRAPVHLRHRNPPGLQPRPPRLPPPDQPGRPDRPVSRLPSQAARPETQLRRRQFARLVPGRRGRPAQLPRLSAYLGHTDPKHTYWYLSAAPELLALASGRLETYLEGQP